MCCSLTLTNGRAAETVPAIEPMVASAAAARCSGAWRYPYRTGGTQQRPARNKEEALWETTFRRDARSA